MDKYIDYLQSKNVWKAKIIKASTIVTAAWVNFKCQYGCSNYNTSWCCPPRTPNAEKMREIIGEYQTAILFAVDDINLPGKTAYELGKMLFADGYYKALALGSGPCRKCKDFKHCISHDCRNPETAIPSMEACGIDVFQTARNNNFYIDTIKDQSDELNFFSMVLVE